MNEHPWSVFGPAPYKLTRYFKSEFQACPGAPVRAGRSCDACGESIKHCFVIRAANGCEFVVGSECVLKAHPDWRRGMAGLRRDWTRSERARISAAEQRARNGGLLDREVREAQAEGRDAARRWLDAEKRWAARWYGEVGKRVSVVVRIVRRIPVGQDGPYPKMLNVFDVCGQELVWFQSGLSVGQVGETVRIKATIKAHDEYRGVKRTVLARCALVERLAEATR